jgi:probable phosphomutase (TIGR03848 family)
MGESTTYVLLIRHGENDWVSERRLAGRTPGVHLNDRGRDQAQRISEMLAGQEINAVYSSPLERCMETAQPIAESSGLALTPEAGIQEVDYGEWQGGNLKELSQGAEWSLVQHSPSSFRFPDGETLFEVQARAIETIERIRRKHPNEVVAIFSHGDVIRTAVAHYMGIPFDLFQRVMINTASITAIAFYGPVGRVLFTNRVADLPKFEFATDEEEKVAQDDECDSEHGTGAPEIL